MIRFEGVTDQGLVRPNNEDTWACDPDADFFLVSDGMGGMASGETASAMVAECVSQLLRKRLGKARGENAVKDAVRRTLIEVSEKIKKEGMENPVNYGMGATAVIAVVKEGALTIGHVGDSRAYLLRGPRLELLTRDHSKAQELINEGKLDPAFVRGHPGRFQLTQCMGMGGVPEPGLLTVKLTERDRVLLATDGVSDMLEDSEIESLLAQAAGPGDACREIVRAAKEAGGKDNITAVVLEVSDSCA